MKRTFIIIFLLSLFPLVGYFITSDLPHTHDGFVHLVRIGAYFKALSDGQILPRWAGDLNFGYGMPIFNFIYQLPYLIASMFVALGSSLVVSFKLTVIMSHLIGAVGIYLFAKELFDDEKKILLVSILYQFAPFRIVELLVRGSFGELYTYAFLPFVLYGLAKLSKKPNLKFVALVSISTALLVLSHNSISLVFFGVAALFLLFTAPSRKTLLWGLSGLTGGLLASSFYWAPALLEHKYTYGNLFMKDLYTNYFPTISQLFVPNITNNPALQNGGVSVQIGIFHTIPILLGLWYLFQKKTNKTNKKQILFSLTIIAGSIVLMLPISSLLWQNISLLRQFQFPWRLLAPVSIATSILGILYMHIHILKKPFIFWFLILSIVFSTAYYWVPPLGYDHITDEAEYWNYPLDTTYFGETNVIWSAGSAKEYPKERVHAIEGTAVVTNFLKKTTIHTFTVKSTQSAKLVDHTQYFPGWNVYVDAQKIPVQFQDQNWRGLVTFSVPPGKHEVIVKFEDNKIRTITRMISIGTLTILGLILFFRK